MDSSIKLKIREDNDLFRSEMAEELGAILMSEEVIKSPLKKDIIYHVMDFEFEGESDDEHRYGVFELDNKNIYFQIDYFGKDFVSPKNPYEESDFKRVLSIGILD